MEPDDNAEPPPLSRLELIAAFITLRDPDILVRCSRGERLQAIHDLYLLILIGGLELGLWTVTLWKFSVPLPIAFACGALVAAIIMAIDVRLTASDTHPRGVLRQGPPPRHFFWFIGSRILVSLVLSNATATGMDLAVFRDEAVQIVDRERDAENAPIIADYDKKLASLRAHEVGPLEDQVTALGQHRAQILAEQSDARTRIEGAREDAQAADLETEREVNGVNRPGGNGPLAKDAAKRRELAADQSRILADHQLNLSQDAARLGQEIDAANANLAQAEPRFVEETRQIKAERDSRLMKSASGPLTVVRGLIKLRNDPEQAPALWLVTGLSWSCIMTLELAYFLARSVFKPPSFYDLALITDLQRRAAKLAHDFAERVRAWRRRQPLHVVDDDEPRQGGDQP